MFAFDGSLLWRLATWAIGAYLVAITTLLALGVEAAPLG
jgi:hypothetical protein